MEKIHKHHCKYNPNHTRDIPLSWDNVWLCEMGKTGIQHYRCRKCTEKVRRLAEWRKREEKITLRQMIKKRHQMYIHELPDSYVIRRIKFANKLLANVDIDPALIELARVSLKLKFLLERKHKSAVNCPTHGNLYRHEMIKAGHNKIGEQRYKCKLCMQQLHKRHYDNNKQKVLAKQKEYRLANPEKVKESKIKSRRKCNANNTKHENVTG